MLIVFGLSGLSGVCYQSTHLWGGFMGEPRGQRHASANSSELLRVPMTRILLGLCTPSTSLDFSAPTVELPHQI